MPQVHYRKFEDAVAGKNRYGYFESLLYIQPKRQENIRMETSISPLKPWPLQLTISLPLHNHEDMEKIVDGILDLFDSLRGEYGGEEKISSSNSFEKLILGGE